jgi:type IV secretion system protein VirD4
MATTPNLFMVPAAAGLATTSSGLLLAMIQQLYRSRSLIANPYLHGSARWAERRDIQEAGLLENDGVYVGAWIHPKTRQLHYLRHAGPEHILCYAPTRSNSIEPGAR